MHKKIIPVLILASIYVFALPVFAQTPVTTSGGATGVVTSGGATGVGTSGGATGIVTSGNPSTGLLNPLNATSLPALLQEILAYVVQIGALFVTLMLIYVGFLFVSARGNEEKVGQARNALLWTVIGGLILLGASALAAVITSTIQNL